MHFFSAANFVSCEAKYRGGCQTFDFFLFFSHFCLPASGQFVFTGVVTFPPRFLPSIFIAYRVQQSRCSSIFHRALLPHALALSASQFVHKKKSQRIYTSMNSTGLELTELTYTRPEDNLIRHRGDRSGNPPVYRGEHPILYKGSAWAGQYFNKSSCSCPI